MTAVVGVARGPRVWLAGDSGLSSGELTLRSATPKVWQVATGVLVGYAGLAQGHAVLWGRWRPEPPNGRGVEAWLYGVAAPQLQALLGDLPAPDDTGHCDLLLGLRGQLWVWSAGGLDSVGPRAAIGSAAAFCQGVLAYVPARAEPARLAARAVELACEWCDGVRGPVVTVTA